MSDVAKLVNDAYVCDENGKPIEGLEVDSINVNPTSQLINAPVEGGTKRFDHKVREPIQITVKAYVTSENFQRVCSKLREYYETNQWKFCRIITKEKKYYDNMALQNMPHEESSEKYDVLYFTLTFLEIIETNLAEKKESSDAGDSSTQNMGRTGVS